jgi:hypothetical protein
VRRFTRRELLLVAAVLVLGAVATVLGLVDRAGWSAGAAALLITPLVVLLFDLRHRARLQAKVLVRQNEELLVLREQLEAVAGRLKVLPTREWFARQEETGRRAVAAIEQLRLDHYDRHVATTRDLSAAGTALDRLQKSQDRIGKDLGREIAAVRRFDEGDDKRRAMDLQRVEALLQLYRTYVPDGLVPLSGRWAMDAVGLFALARIVEDRRPGLIVELGGGTSTVWLAHVLRGVPGSRLVSLDHDERFSGSTARAVQALAPDAPVEVRHAPLEDVTVGGWSAPWYARSTMDDLAGIDLLVVDGPPGTTSDEARYPAVPVLLDRLSDDAVVLLDDAGRPDERHVVERWLEECPGLELDRTTWPAGRHAVFRFRRPAG